jgi:hypothetical protein
MGIAYRCDKTTGLCVSVWDGVVTDEQRRQHMATLEADPEWGAGGLLLTDLTGVSAARRPTAKQVLETAADFSERLAPMVRDAKWAMVAGETFVLAQRFGSYLEEEVPRLIVFNDLATACTWLGVDGAEVGTLLDELRGEVRASETSSRTPPN